MSHTYLHICEAMLDLTKPASAVIIILCNKIAENNIGNV